jgi:hypothetical protein
MLLVVVLVIGTLACGVGGLGSTQGSGQVVEEEFEVSGFTGVRFETIGTLYIEIGEEEGLVVEAEDNLIEHFVVEVDGKVLKIGGESGVSLSPTTPINFYLTVKQLDTIVLAGSGDVEAPDLAAEKFTATVSGSGDIDMDGLVATTLDVVLSGSGDLEISDGRVDEQDISISGSGKYDARDLASAVADVNISGSGSATILVSDSLEVNIAGSGSVRYAGSPNLDKLTVSGSGTVEQIGE